MKKIAMIVIALLLFGSSAFAQTYVGDQACAGCHANMPSAGFFDGYMNSGHPWKIFNTAGAVPAADTWPFTPVPPLPVVDGIQLTWADVEYVIGNYHWKTRYVRPDGFIYTGQSDETTQWNLLVPGWVPYHAGEVDKPFNCGRCHTTGYDPAGNQDGLPGLIGTWAQDGIRCEACHGPASAHVANPTVPPPGGKDCSECHYRDSQFRMPWKGGFMRHHQQAEDLSHSPHSFFDCSTCHNPHRSVVNNDGGTITTCTQCHPGDASNNNYIVPTMENVDCIDCHMPFMAKSGQSFNTYTGDIRGHLFQVMTSPTAAADNVTDGFWNQDMNGDAFVTLDYACLGCHEDIGDGLTLEQAAIIATNMHTGSLIPVTLQDLAATVTEAGVSLSWRLAPTDVPEARDIRVQRSRAMEGPYEERSGSLRPEALMSFEDTNVEEGVTYWYRIMATDMEGVQTFAGPVEIAFSGRNWSTALYDSWQLPSGKIEVRYSIGTASTVRLEIYDVAGRRINVLDQGRLDPGRYTETWNGRDEQGKAVARGTYFVRLTAGRESTSAKIIVAQK